MLPISHVHGNGLGIGKRSPLLDTGRTLEALCPPLLVVHDDIGVVEVAVVPVGLQAISRVSVAIWDLGRIVISLR